MNRPRILRLLQIGWSAGWGITCLLLMAFWMRSYSNSIFFQNRYNLLFISQEGKLCVWQFPPAPPPSNFEEPTWVHHKVEKPLQLKLTDQQGGFYARWHSSTFWLIQAPYWFLVVVSATFAAASWVPWS